MATDLPDETQHLIERLLAVNREQPLVDRSRIEAAVYQHLQALKLDRLAIRWARDAESGYLAARDYMENEEWVAAADVTKRKLKSALTESVRRSIYTGLGNWLWNEADRAARHNAELRSWTLACMGGKSHHWTAPRSPSVSMLLRAVGWTAVTRGPLRVIEQHRSAWCPLADAFADGLWLMWVLHDRVILVARPRLKASRNRLHCPDGPAVAWPSGLAYFFWDGVRVPRWFILRPEQITTRRAWLVTNAEFRRVMIERIGYERFLRESLALPVHEDKFGMLYRISMRGDHPLMVVQLTNATPEPDGSTRRYFLRVPPTVRTAHEAVAWTFASEAQEYGPSAET